MNAYELRKALEMDFEVTEYSGRGMMGARCIGCRIEEVTDLFQIGRVLADQDIGAPKIDNLGRGYIAYWPRIKIVDDAAA